MSDNMTGVMREAFKEFGETKRKGSQSGLGIPVPTKEHIYLMMISMQEWLRHQATC